MQNHFARYTTILSLGNNAYQIFQSSKVETKREILHILLSNLKLQDRKISYTLRKPYDYIKSLNKKTPPKNEGVANGEPTEMNCELLTSETYYNATIDTYEKILLFCANNNELQQVVKAS